MYYHASIFIADDLPYFKMAGVSLTIVPNGRSSEFIS